MAAEPLIRRFCCSPLASACVWLAAMSVPAPARGEYFPAEMRMADEQPFTLDAGEVREVPLFAPNSAFRIDVVGAMKRSGHRVGDDDSAWGVEFRDAEGRARLDVRLLCGTEPFDATFSRPYLRVTVDSIDVAGNRHPVDNRQLFNGVNMYKGFNGLRISYGNYKVLVAVGSKVLLTASGFNYDTPLVSASVGGNRSLEVRYLEVKAEPARWVPLQSGWSADEASGYAATANGIEGIWEFLDRDTNARIAEPGGAYRLAVVPHRHTAWCGCPASDKIDGTYRMERPAGAKDANAVYDVVYLGGGRIYEKYWSPGMVKGRLYATGFENHYALQWFDSEMLPIGTEISADFTAPSILAFNFPLLKSTLRFSRR